jgi:hypothetical protein
LEVEALAEAREEREVAAEEVEALVAGIGVEGAVEEAEPEEGLAATAVVRAEVVAASAAGMEAD